MTNQESNDERFHSEESKRFARLRHEFRQRFGGDPSIATRTPGRVDLMGSHTDYNGGLVCTMAIDRDTWILARPRSDDVVSLYSANENSSCQFSLDDFKSVSGWGRYVQAVAFALRNEEHTLSGMEAVVHGTIPLGSGLSSSASLEVAAATTWELLEGFQLSNLQKAKLCQQAENRWVGVPCGLLDQYSVVFGQPDSLMALDCRKFSHQTFSFPKNISVVVCDTGAPRTLVDSEYESRRKQCEQALQVFASRIDGVDHLCQVQREAFEEYKHLLGDECQRRMQFVLDEHQRVEELIAATQSGDTECIRRLCEQSFFGARDLYQICIPEMECMFEAMRNSAGYLGGRQAGAGFGGCLVAFVDGDFIAAFEKEVRQKYLVLANRSAKTYVVRPALGTSQLDLC